jgi:phospholipid/cholesterol/gamma-HCH transport system substrate-binding protein
MIGDAQKALQSIDQAAAQIAELSKSSQNLVDTDGRRTLKNLADASEQAQVAAKDVRVIVGRLDGPTREFASSGLPQLTAAVQTLQQTAESLDRLIRDVEANPRGLATKAPAEEIKVKP